MYNLLILVFWQEKTLEEKSFQKKDNNRSKTRWQIYSLIKLLSIKWRAYSKMYVCRMYVCMYVWHYKPNTMESNSFVFPWGSEATPSATLSLKRSYKLSLAALSNMAKILLSPIFSVLEDSPKQYRGVLKIWFLAKRYVFF